MAGCLRFPHFFAYNGDTLSCSNWRARMIEILLMLFRTIKILKKHSRQTQKALQDSTGALTSIDPTTAALLRRRNSRILRFTWMAFILGSIILPVLSPWVGMWLYNRGDEKEIIGSACCGTGGSILFGPLYLFGGLSAGLLTVPTTFFASPVGEIWMKLIGTKNVITARIACLLLTIIAAAVMVAIAALLMFAVGHPGGAK